ncbi:MAG: hypothetical protein IPJ19_21560 [Planctomycetes bacterium]|nr:hypothetical protein [Planctomycetota bacterium]
MKTILQHETARGRRGSALVPALMTVMLTAALCVSYLQLAISKNHESQVSIDAKRAFYIAEAGLSEAYYGLARGLDGSVACEAEPARFGTGVYWVTCEDLGTRVVLHSTGLSGLGRAALSVTLSKARGSVAGLGLYANQQIDMAGGALVDAYDSTQGLYRPSGGGPPVQAFVGCNQSINLAGKSGALAGARIDGDAIPGPSGSVIRGKGATVTGSTAPALESTELPTLQIQVPVDAIAMQPAPGVAQHLPAGDYAWTVLHLVNGASLVIDGPANVVLDQLVLDTGSQLTLDGNSGTVFVSVRSYVKLTAGSQFSTLSLAPERVSLLTSASETIDRNGDGIPDAPVTLASSGAFYGLFYAPGAQLDLPPSFTVFGALVADRVHLQGGAQVHLDRALRDSLANGTLPQFVCWRVEELPESPLVKMGYDPLSVLQASNVPLVSPAAAHIPPGQIRSALVHALKVPKKL